MLKNLMKLFIWKKKKKLSTLEICDRGQLYFCKIAIHTGEKEAALGHLKLWVPLLKALNYDICIITRDKDVYKSCMKEFLYANIIYAKGASHVEMIMNNLNIKIIFYLSNTGNNLHLCKFNTYKHIFLGHGDSNKTSSAHNGFKIYDEVWVAGQAHIDRFTNADIDVSGIVFRVVGQPQLSLIHKEPNPKKSLLYLPTWEGIYKEQSYSSLLIAESILCNDGIEMNSIAIKLHPLTGTKNKQYSKIASNLIDALNAKGIQVQRYPSSINVLDVMPEHSGFICDNSAVITSALFFDKPLFVYIPKRAKYCNTDINYDDFSYTFSTQDEFESCYKDFIENGDSKKEARIVAADYFMSQKSMRMNCFQEYICELLEK